MMLKQENDNNSVKKMCHNFVFLNIFRKLYSENFTEKNAPYFSRKSEVDKVKIMTLSSANFSKRIHEIATVLYFSHLRV